MFSDPDSVPLDELYPEDAADGEDPWFSGSAALEESPRALPFLPGDLTDAGPWRQAEAANAALLADAAGAAGRLMGRLSAAEGLARYREQIRLRAAVEIAGWAGLEADALAVRCAGAALLGVPDEGTGAALRAARVLASGADLAEVPGTDAAEGLSGLVRSGVHGIPAWERLPPSVRSDTARWAADTVAATRGCHWITRTAAVLGGWTGPLRDRAGETVEACALAMAAAAPENRELGFAPMAWGGRLRRRLIRGGPAEEMVRLVARSVRDSAAAIDRELVRLETWRHRALEAAPVRGRPSPARDALIEGAACLGLVWCAPALAREHGTTVRSLERAARQLADQGLLRPAGSIAHKRLWEAAIRPG